MRPNVIASRGDRDVDWRQHHRGGRLKFPRVRGKTAEPIVGAMLQQAQEFMRIAWWMAVYPGLCIIITVFWFNILGDSLRDVLALRLK